MSLIRFTLVFLLFSGVDCHAQQTSCKTIGDRQNGLYIEYFPNCSKKLESYFKNGKPDSTYTEWTENGKLKIKGYYRNGKKEGVWRHEKTLIDQGYRESYNYKYVEYTYRNDSLKNAYEYLSSSDSITPKSGEKFVAYGKDTLTRSLGFHRNGQLNWEAFLKNGTLDSIYSSWDENGKLFREDFMNDGFLVKEILYYTHFITVTTYQPGMKIVSIKQYTLYGDLLYEEYYINGRVSEKKGEKQVK